MNCGLHAKVEKASLYGLCMVVVCNKAFRFLQIHLRDGTAQESGMQKEIRLQLKLTEIFNLWFQNTVEAANAGGKTN